MNKIFLYDGALDMKHIEFTCSSPRELRTHINILQGLKNHLVYITFL